jgi:hypothetical protein
MRACFLLVAYFCYSPKLKKEAVLSTETSLNLYRTTRLHIPECNTLHGQRCIILKRNIVFEDFHGFPQSMLGCMLK